MIITLDFETYSECPIDRGSDNYGRHPSTEILCMAVARDDDEPELWVPGDDLPTWFVDAIEDGESLFAHNAGFEQAIWPIGMREWGFPSVSPDQWRCTMAAAAMYTLPLSLAHVSNYLDLDDQKDSGGKALIKLLCMPQKTKFKMTKKDQAMYKKAGHEDLVQQTLDSEHYNAEFTWRCTDAGKLQELYDYCVQDVKTQHELTKVLGELPEHEQKVWLLDQKINQTGVPVDLELVDKLIEVSDAEAAQLHEDMANLTDGSVQSTNQSKALAAWLTETLGEPIDSVAVEPVEKLLKRPDLDPTVRSVLRVRQAAAKSSVGKLEAFKQKTSDHDSRLRGTLIYHGATTGRWTGRGVQPHNFPRGMHSEKFINIARDIIYDDVTALRMFDKPLDVVSSSLRSCIATEADSRLLVVDYAGVESRVVACLVGEEELINTVKTGGDVYKVMAGRIFDKDPSQIDKGERQLGKAAILGCGFGMGPAKFAATAGLDFRTARKIVKVYRDTNPRISGFWRDINDLFVDTINNREENKICGLTLRYEEDLFPGKDVASIELLSGRRLYYLEPHVRQVVAPWCKVKIGRMAIKKGQRRPIDQLGIALDDEPDDVKGDWEIWKNVRVPDGIKPWLDSKFRHIARFVVDGEPELSYVPEITTLKHTMKGPVRRKVYGGLLTENIVQAIARDLLASSMLALDEAGFKVIGTVHDEALCETHLAFGPEKRLKDMEEIMTTNPPWAADWPIDVEGFVSQRYKK